MDYERTVEATIRHLNIVENRNSNSNGITLGLLAVAAAIREAADPAKSVTVELKSEVSTSNKPAFIIVRSGAQIVATVEATIERRQGADGGYYPCVTLKQT